MVVEQLLLNHYVQAVNALKELETKDQALFSKVLETLRSLKSGDISLDSVVVTDEGWEITPSPTPPNPEVLGSWMAAPVDGPVEV